MDQGYTNQPGNFYGNNIPIRHCIEVNNNLYSIIPAPSLKANEPRFTVYPSDNTNSSSNTFTVKSVVSSGVVRRSRLRVLEYQVKSESTDTIFNTSVTRNLATGTTTMHTTTILASDNSTKGSPTESGLSGGAIFGITIAAIVSFLILTIGSTYLSFFYCCQGNYNPGED